MVLWVSKLKIPKAFKRKAPNSFRNKSFPQKVLRSKARFEVGLGGGGGRRGRIKSRRSGGFQLLGEGWPSRQGDRGAAWPKSGPFSSVTASMLPRGAHRAVRNGDARQGSEGECLGLSEGSAGGQKREARVLLCGAQHPVGLTPPGVVARPSMVLPARVLSWPTSLVPHRAARNRLVLTSQANREFTFCAPNTRPNHRTQTPPGCFQGRVLETRQTGETERDGGHLDSKLVPPTTF